MGIIVSDEEVAPRRLVAPGRAQIIGMGTSHRNGNEEGKTGKTGNSETSPWLSRSSQTSTSYQNGSPGRFPSCGGEMGEGKSAGCARWGGLASSISFSVWERRASTVARKAWPGALALPPSGCWTGVLAAPPPGCRPGASGRAPCWGVAVGGAVWAAARPARSMGEAMRAAAERVRAAL